MPVVSKQTNNAPKTTGASIIKSIQAVSELPDEGVKMLITGPTGSGKTRLSCTAPKPLLLIRPEQVEDGSKSVKNVPGVFTPDQLTDCAQLDELIELQRQTKKYKTIVLDGVQFYQDLVLKKVLNLKEIPAQLSWGIATQQDWGVVSNELKERLRRLLRLAKEGSKPNIIITGGERMINDDKESDLLTPKIVVALTPSSAGWLNFVCDYVVCTFYRRRMETITTKIANKDVTTTRPGKSIEFVVRTQPNEVYEAKFRASLGVTIPEEIVDPTFDKMTKFMK